MDHQIAKQEHEGPITSQDGEIENFLQPPNSDEDGIDIARDKLMTRTRESGKHPKESGDSTAR